jgi:soluble lytic murein transglycosylase
MTPDANANPPHNPFSFLKAILIGTAIGFLVVLAAPYLAPAHRGPLTYATADVQPDPIKVSAAASRSTQKHSLSAAVKSADASLNPPAEPSARAPAGSSLSPEAKQPVEAKDGQPPDPIAGEPGKETAPIEPVLVPAVNLTFPKTFSAEEMTAALQPLLSFRISDGDAAAIKDVISSVSRGDDASARAAIRKISDPAARSFAEWKRLRASSADFNEVMAFRRAHPLFPEPAQEPCFFPMLQPPMC